MISQGCTHSILCLLRSSIGFSDILRAGEQLLNQQHLISASLKSGTVKRFLPSEFSYDLSAGSTTTPELFEPKRKIQKLLQETKLPYTIVSSNGFMEHWYPGEHAIPLYWIHAML